MKFTAPAAALREAVGVAAGAVAGRSTKPILACVKVEAAGDALTLTATDLEVTLAYGVPGVRVDRPGAAVLPAAKLNELLRAAGDADVTVNATGEAATVRAGAARYDLPTHDPAEFPAEAEPDPEAAGSAHEVTAGVLRGLLRRTVFAADRREGSRFAVACVLWEAEPGKVRLVATDTRRLAVCEGPAAVAGDGTGTRQHLVPLKAVGLLERLLADDGEAVRVVLTPNAAEFRTERATLTARLVDGKFPPYRSILPKKLDHAIELPAGEFLARVRQAAIMTDAETKRVDLRFGMGGVTLAAKGAEAGASEVTLDLPAYPGPDLAVSFDPAYLRDYLGACGAEAVVLEVTDGTKPAVLRAGDDSLCLIMPLAN